jgi:uncharacterized Zn finger protein
MDRVRKLAGNKVFARGQDYFEARQVEILAIEPKQILAQVTGTEDYRTTLTGRGKAIGGACSCPAFGDWGFCKHMVAVALTVNALGQDADVQEGGALTRIETILRKGVEALIDMVMALVERDPTLFRKLDMASAIERAALALKLASRAIERIEQSIESIDDSDGHCGALLRRAGDIHLDAAKEVRPDPVQFARDLFAREMNDEYDAFGDIVSAYADVLGEVGHAEYRRLASEAWEKLPPRTGKTSSRETLHHGDYFALMRILDYFAEREAYKEAAMLIRRMADLQSTTERASYLASLKQRHGRKRNLMKEVG